MWNRISGLVGLILFVSGSVSASAEEGGWSFQVSSQIMSNYPGVTDATLVSKEPVIQTDLNASRSIGDCNECIFYAGLWTSFGLDDTDLSSNSADEVDYYIGVNFPVGSVVVDASLAYFDVYEIGKHNSIDSMEFALDVSSPFAIGEGHTLAPFVKLAPQITFGNGRGLQTFAGVRYSAHVAGPVSLNGTFQLAHDTGAFGAPASLTGHADAHLAWQIGSVTVKPLIVQVAKTLAREDGGTDKTATFGAGLSFSF